MGLFNRDQTEVRSFVMRRTLATQGPMMLTLGYPGANPGGRSWVAGFGVWTQEPIDFNRAPSQAELQAFVDQLNARTLGAIRQYYPSAVLVEGPFTDIRPDQDPKFPVTTTGTVRVSPKDHEAMVSQPGETFAPGPNWRPGQ